jgi:hypothetical protein
MRARLEAGMAAARGRNARLVQPPFPFRGSQVAARDGSKWTFKNGFSKMIFQK